MSDQNGKLIIFGVGQMAEVITFYLERFSDYEIVGYTVDRDYLPNGDFAGKKVVAWDELEAHHPPGSVALMGPLTYQRLNQVRRDRYLEGKARGYRFASFIHPDNNIYTDAIGEHCIILENNVIQPFASIGNNVILWSGNHIGHHSSVGDHCFFASQVGISGSCTIATECYFGGQAGIPHGIKVGHRCVFLNRGGYTKDVPDDSVVVGETLKPYKSSRILHLI